MTGGKGISSFSVLLIMAVASFIGIVCMTRLNVQYVPPQGNNTITVSFLYPGASSRVVEAEVTSRIEGALANIRSCTGIESTSYDGAGFIEFSMDRKADMEAVRFEIASSIRNMWNSLPEGCYYPSISLNAHGTRTQTAIAYFITSSLETREIADFVNERLVYPISSVKGVSSVSFYGYTPYEWVITFDYDRAAAYGIQASDIAGSISDYYREDVVGMVRNGDYTYAVKLKNDSKEDFAEIPVKNAGGRVIRLGEIATFSYQESVPRSYYRINGLNTLTLSVDVAPDVNMISVVDEVNEKLSEIQIPEEISIVVGYDSSEYVREELDKVYLRTALCLLILLLFVFAVNRSWKYMTVIAITLAVNLLVSVALYFFFGLGIHIYTLAGITVSLGIIIDNSIVMIDHWTRFRSRSVFPAILSSVLTTVAALLVIFLLPESERANLVDFSLVIVINLCVSLLVAYLFVPALLDYFPVDRDAFHSSVSRLRRTVRRNARYERYIFWGQRHRLLLVLLFIIVFGLPTVLLPEKFGNEKTAPLKPYEKVLNKIVGWRPYASNKDAIDALLGSTFAVFHQAISHSDFYREPSRPELIITASMPEGCTVAQLNDVIKAMENYLAGFDEIETFQSSVRSSTAATIGVLFKPEFENTRIPGRIKREVVDVAKDFGGANWNVTGIDNNSFSNDIVSKYKNSGIVLTGYNFDELQRYGEILIDYLGAKRRVSGPEIWSGDGDFLPKLEFGVNYDFEKLMANGISPYSYHQSLYSPLYSSTVLSLPENGEYIDVRLESSSKDKFDVWNVDNTAVQTGEGKMKLSEVGEIAKQRSSIVIMRRNQSYSINVRYDFIGNAVLAEKTAEDAVKYMNSEILPVGYHAEKDTYSWFFDSKEKYVGLIMLVIALIFVICTVHFNSLRAPLAIIWMIPISFIGVFIVFGYTGFNFDNGGFAAFVMLSGITVNAGIYMISAWRSYRRNLPEVRRYVRALNIKIWPIFLTVVSTILGLIPFLFDGPRETFWFSFAIGTIAGLVFAMIGFFLYLPVFACKKR